MQIDFDYFSKLIQRHLEVSSEKGITVTEIVIKERADLGVPVAYFYGDKDGVKMDGAVMLKAST